jgi:hypothetical protein
VENKRGHHALAVLFKLNDTNRLGFENLLLTEFFKHIKIFNADVTTARHVNVTPIKNLLYFALNYFKMYHESVYGKNKSSTMQAKMDIIEMINQSARMADLLLSAIKTNYKVNGQT